MKDITGKELTLKCAEKYADGTLCVKAYTKDGVYRGTFRGYRQRYFLDIKLYPAAHNSLLEHRTYKVDEMDITFI